MFIYICNNKEIEKKLEKYKQKYFAKKTIFINIFGLSLFFIQ